MHTIRYNEKHYGLFEEIETAERILTSLGAKKRSYDGPWQIVGRCGAVRELTVDFVTDVKHIADLETDLQLDIHPL